MGKVENRDSVLADKYVDESGEAIEPFEETSALMMLLRSLQQKQARGNDVRLGAS